MERCEAIANTYTGGDVLTIHLPEAASAESIARLLSERLSDSSKPASHAIFTLSGDTLISALDAVLTTRDVLDRDILIASLGSHEDLFNYNIEDARHHLAFSLSDLAQVQGFLITSALYLFDVTPQPSWFFDQPSILLGTPNLSLSQSEAGNGITPPIREAMRLKLDAILTAVDDR